jgi:hypothetical protein
MLGDVKSILVEYIFKNASQMFPLLNTSSIVVNTQVSCVVKEKCGASVSAKSKQIMLTSHEFFDLKLIPLAVSLPDLDFYVGYFVLGTLYMKILLRARCVCCVIQ